MNPKSAPEQCLDADVSAPGSYELPQPEKHSDRLAMPLNAPLGCT